VNSFLTTLGTGQIFQERESDPFVYANRFLETTDQVASPISSISVRWQRGKTLEDMAQQFLGDPNRARELALLNNLRPPFVDETGFTRPIFNANGREFVVNSNENLAIDQRITIKSSSASPSRRTIIDLDDIGGGQYRIVVDGADNLNIYTPASSPFIEFRTPGTVGSGDYILIPDTTLPVDAFPIKPSATFDRLAHAEKVFKVDLALDERTGRDLVVGPANNVKRSFGYDNALQALRLATEIERGELEQHPEKGLAAPIGQRNSDFNLTEIGRLVEDTIVSDARFASAITQVEIDGSVSRVTIDAEGSNGTGQIPVEFEVGKE
jgi:hypothetical protein